MSKHTAAHFTYVEEIDCTDLVALRERANARAAAQGTKLSFLPFIVKATAAALVKFPQLNATLDEAAGEIIQRGHRHIGLATATDVGLIVPVVRDADRLSIVELAAEIERLAGLTRAGKAAREELTGLDVHDHQPGRAGRPAWRRRSSIIPRSRSWACTRSASGPAVAATASSSAT